jgi:hypothetical protein
MLLQEVIHLTSLNTPRYFKAQHYLLIRLKIDYVPSDQAIKDAKVFVCKVYKDTTTGSTNDYLSMFVNGITNDKLLPKSDALLYHINRSQ